MNKVNRISIADDKNDMVMALCHPAGEPKWLRDATLNDSDKSFGPAQGYRWIIHAVGFSFTATATVGSRYAAIEVQNGGGTPYWCCGNNTAITASQVAKMVGGPSFPISTTAIRWVEPFTAPNSAFIAVLPNPCILDYGMVLRFRDIQAIDAAADDIVVQIHYTEVKVS